MTAPNPKHIRIRLEIDVPTGVPICGPIGVAVQQGQEGPPVAYKFHKPVPKADDTSCVRLVSGSLLGTFTFSCEYISPYPTDVRAIGYPESLDPGFTAASSCPTGAVLGKKLLGGKLWEWNDTHANRVPGGDHSATGRYNIINVFRDAGSGLLFDGSVRVLGVTEGQGSCQGSGNELGMGMEEMLAAEVFLISVPDGPNAGRHYAKRQSRRECVAQVGKESWVVSFDEAGTLTVRVGRRAVASKKTNSNPFSATFHGEPFGAKGDVVVTAA